MARILLVFEPTPPKPPLRNGGEERARTTPKRNKNPSAGSSHPHAPRPTVHHPDLALSRWKGETTRTIPARPETPFVEFGEPLTSVMVSLAAMTRFRARKRRTGKPGPSVSSSVLVGRGKRNCRGMAVAIIRRQERRSVFSPLRRWRADSRRRSLLSSR